MDSLRNLPAHVRRLSKSPRALPEVGGVDEAGGVDPGRGAVERPVPIVGYEAEGAGPFVVGDGRGDPVGECDGAAVGDGEGEGAGVGEGVAVGEGGSLGDDEAVGDGESVGAIRPPESVVNTLFTICSGPILGAAT
ncbi:hypothetical protein [Actinoallomurus rhizosphaericola]|uniref:hypothetical protein n=1 Tax=Actinoallomurus rhizosphaericola TaxID=2952536 RepID=UPI00209329C6|nr:hypothetical protein [Actinoallomurus rhizosphaericola]MCO5996135.1 hypothetical protein [Actinoallomurus rhizosphaericola]